MFRLSKTKIIILIFLLVTGFLLYRNFSASKTNGIKKDQTYRVQKTDLKQTLTLSGKIAADEMATLRFQTSGKLTWIGVKEGDIVGKYQLLATLDKREIQKNLEKKLNTYLNTRWEFEQTQDDNNVDGRKLQDVILSDAERRILEESQFGLNNAVLDVEIQNLALEYANLYSPIAGIVTRADTPYAGVNITPAGSEIDIINPVSVYLSVSADQNEVINLKPGMAAEIVMDPYPEEKLKGTVNTVSFTPKAGESNTVYEVKLTMPDSNNIMKYRMDMTADAVFVIKEKTDILSVPTLSIKAENGKKYVYRQKGNKKEKVYIETGTEFDNDTEIISGLSEGDLVYD